MQKRRNISIGLRDEHASINACLAALDIRDFISEFSNTIDFLDLRCSIGIYIGELFVELDFSDKYQFDIFGKAFTMAKKLSHNPNVNQESLIHIGDSIAKKLDKDFFEHSELTNSKSIDTTESGIHLSTHHLFGKLRNDFVVPKIYNSFPLQHIQSTAFSTNRNYINYVQSLVSGRKIFCFQKQQNNLNTFKATSQKLSFISEQNEKNNQLPINGLTSSVREQPQNTSQKKRTEYQYRKPLYVCSDSKMLLIMQINREFIDNLRNIVFKTPNYSENTDFVNNKPKTKIQITKIVENEDFNNKTGNHDNNSIHTTKKIKKTSRKIAVQLNSNHQINQEQRNINEKSAPETKNSNSSLLTNSDDDGGSDLEDYQQNRKHLHEKEEKNNSTMMKPLLSKKETHINNNNQNNINEKDQEDREYDSDDSLYYDTDDSSQDIDVDYQDKKNDDKYNNDIASIDEDDSEFSFHHTSYQSERCEEYSNNNNQARKRQTFILSENNERNDIDLEKQQNNDDDKSKKTSEEKKRERLKKKELEYFSLYKHNMEIQGKKMINRDPKSADAPFSAHDKIQHFKALLVKSVFRIYDLQFIQFIKRTQRHNDKKEEEKNIFHYLVLVNSNFPLHRNFY